MTSSGGVAVRTCEIGAFSAVIAARAMVFGIDPWLATRIGVELGAGEMHPWRK